MGEGKSMRRKVGSVIAKRHQVDQWTGASLTGVGFIAMVQVLVLCDVLVRDQEQYHLAFLILNGYNVQQTPELGP